MLNGKHRDFDVDAQGDVTAVEADVAYEATYTDKNGKEHEFQVKSDGTEAKE